MITKICSNFNTNITQKLPFKHAFSNRVHIPFGDGENRTENLLFFRFYVLYMLQ